MVGSDQRSDAAGLRRTCRDGARTMTHDYKRNGCREAAGFNRRMRKTARPVAWGDRRNPGRST